MAVLDESIANIALPAIGYDLQASPAASVWVVSAYQIAITMALLAFSAAGDIIGHRKVYIAGLGLFTIASLSCAAAPSLTALALARFVQGVGAAAIMAVNGALVRFTYSRSTLGRGVSYNAFVVAVCFAAGPAIAAGILSIASWRWLFAVNVPLGALAVVIGARALPDPVRTNHRFDTLSALLSAAALGAFFFGLAQLAQMNLSLSTFGFIAGGLAAGAATLSRSRGQTHPLIPLDLLRIAPLRLSYLVSMGGFAAHIALLVSLPFYLEHHFRFSHVGIGLLITLLAIAVAIAAPLAGRVIERHSASLVCALGLAVVAAGGMLLAVLPAEAGVAPVAAAMAVCGFGFGFFQTPNNRTMIGLTPRARSGVGSGTTAIARLIGQTTASVAVALAFRLSGPATSSPLYLAAALAGGASLFSLYRMHLIDVPQPA